MRQTALGFPISLIIDCNWMLHGAGRQASPTGSKVNFTGNSHIYGIGTFVLIVQACGTMTFRTAKSHGTHICGKSISLCWSRSSDLSTVIKIEPRSDGPKGQLINEK
jgi:hypothetical protein